MQLNEVKKALKAVASMKCRLAQQTGRPDYAEKMQKVLLEEARLIAIRGELTPKKQLFVTEMGQADIKQLDMDAVRRGLKSIQTAKHHSQWVPDKEKYNHVCQIEAWLQERRSELRPITAKVNKSTVAEIMADNKLTAKQKLQKIQELLT